MTLLRLIRRYGLRTGWSIWLWDVEFRAEERRRPWRTFHGSRPTLPGWRRDR